MRRLLARLLRRGPQPVAPDAATDPPYDRSAAADPDEIRRLEAALDEAGVRLLPYPFNQMLSIVSDCDFSYTANTIDVIRELCFDRNLDFGDSFHLFDFSDRPGSSNVATLSNSGCPPAENFAKTPDEFVQLARLGFADHIHGIASRRPQGLRLEPAAFEKGPNGSTRSRTFEELLSKPSGDGNNATSQVIVRHVEVQFAGPPSEPATALVRLTSGGEIELGAGSEGRDDSSVRFRIPEAPFGRALRVRDINEIRVTGGEVERCTLFPLAREDVAELCGQLNAAELRFNLLTDHASTGFLNVSADAQHRAAQVNQAAVGQAAAALAFFDTPDDPGLLPDVPGSPLYCTDLLASQGLRYINPSGTSGQPLDSLHPLAVLAPSHRRDGAPVYVARRILPAVSKGHLDPNLSKRLQRKSRITTFSARLRTVLDQATATSGPLAFPFYTHLGANQEWEDRPTGFDPGVLGELQDRAFNFSGAVPGHERTYVVRASAFYEYLRVVAQIAGSTRREGNRVRVCPGEDALLREPLVRAPAELHGLTLSVSNSANAVIELDNDPIEDLLRIGAHVGQTEEWVTVLSGGHRQRADLDLASAGKATRVTNLLGNIYYVGIERAGGGTFEEGLPAGLTLRGSGGLSVYFGPAALVPQAGPVAGTLLIQDGVALADRVVWFSLALAKWDASAQSSPGFGTDLDVTIHVAPGSPDQSLVLHLMKPGVTGSAAIDAAIASDTTAHFRRVDGTPIAAVRP